MDPFSITAGCVGILGAVAKTSTSIRDFVRNVREARSELGATARHLAELDITISLIRDDHTLNGSDPAQLIPASITAQTTTVIRGCQDILSELDAVLDKYNPKRHRTVVKWAMKGKEEVAGLNKLLEANTRTLAMALEISTLFVLSLPTLLIGAQLSLPYPAL